MTDVFDRRRHGPEVGKRSRRLRSIMTYPERLLWEALRHHGLPMRRQAPIGRYVADFVCHSAKLVVEVDGYPHSLPEVQERDAARDAWLRSQGYRVLRFHNQEVVGDMNKVIEAISQALPPRWGKGRDGGVPPHFLGEAKAAGPPPDLILQRQGHTPTLPSPIEGEGRSVLHRSRPFPEGR